MSFSIRPALLPALLLWLCVPALAQTARPAPDDPRAPVPALQYQSPLAGYRAQGEPEVGSWRAANERVHQAGGWKAYAREAAQSQPATPGKAQAAGHDHSAAPQAPSAAPGAPGAHDHGQAAPDRAAGMHSPQHHQKHEQHQKQRDQKQQHQHQHQQKHQHHHQHHRGTP
jgi:hypothetical protein